MSDVLDFYSTNSLSWEQLDYNNEDLYNLHYGLIHVGLPILVDIGQNKLPGIKTECKPKNFELCKEGDVAFADASEDTNDVAKAIEFVNLNNQKTVCGLHTIHGRDNKRLTVLGYKGYAFASPLFHNQIRRIAQGTKIYSISSKNFAECYIGIPSKDEQSKIARLLVLIDSRIATQNKIIEDLKKLMVAIRDKLIDNLVNREPLILFSEVYSKASEGGTPETSKSEYYENGNIPFIKIDDLSNKYIISNKDFITDLGLQKSSAWIIPTHSLIYSNGATIGAISINTYEVCTKQGILGIVPKASISVEYLYCLMSSNYFSKQVHRIITHGTMATAYLKDINRIKVPIPCMQKQLEIANTVSSVTNKIERELNILSLLLKQKQYLLQHMFI